ncbi:PTS fructose transporter subunit IIB [Oceanobacillus neutriphilus]|uniref:PTS fructose transporter subunit IIB n=1 Tax=Oceanobacillus neutriphilus TaxID=531815 RepID=A0ABQ2NP57_9BACI|nr:PTS fructose transporter subunit IIB [Oceanobacillus neutriphilus]GGP07765.1 PTS fructose transporter subunit IIB [Oceanobacillus neutriphilus]
MNILAVTACPAGVAHTYMAKKGLEKAAKKMGHKIKVETQGSMGIENEIKATDLEKADLVIWAIDTKIEKANRFDGKTIHEVPVAAAVKNAAKVIEDAIAKL